MEEVLTRFASYYTEGAPDECWHWRGGISSSGYGAFWLDGTTVGAHTVAYRIAHGELPEGMVVRHDCDTRPCVNPNHLRVGLPLDNSGDMVARDRQCQGVEHHSARFTPDTVRELLSLYCGGHASMGRLAEHYGVTLQAVSHILSGRNWKSVTGGIDRRRVLPSDNHNHTERHYSC